MKTLFILLSCTFVFAASAPHAACENLQDASERIVAAETLYTQKEYARAVETYASIIMDGFGNADLYYNLGNALYRNGDISRAVWCYEKALLLNPSHDDAAFNLEFIRNKLLRDQQSVPPAFPADIWLAFGRSFPMHVWLIFALFFPAALLTTTLLFLIAPAKNQRRRWFYTSLALLLLSTIFISRYIAHQIHFKYNHTAVVLNDGAVMRSEPQNDGQHLQLLPGGSFVKIKEFSNQWYKILAPDGTLGWLPETSVAPLSDNLPSNTVQAAEEMK